MLIDREIDNLTHNFGGIMPMKALPAALFVVDSRREHIAIAEAHRMNIPVIALMNSDCNMADVEYPIVGNDTARASVGLFA